jgi:hypothetical protein
MLVVDSVRVRHLETSSVRCIEISLLFARQMPHHCSVCVRTLDDSFTTILKALFIAVPIFFFKVPETRSRYPIINYWAAGICFIASVCNVIVAVGALHNWHVWTEHEFIFRCYTFYKALSIILCYENYSVIIVLREPGSLSRYSNSLRAGRCGDRIPVGAWFSAPVQTGPGAHPASYKMGTGSFPGGKAAGAWRWPPTPI